MIKIKPVEKRVRKPALAALLSVLVPGLGQVYAGSLGRGIALFFGMAVQGALFYSLNMRALTDWLSLIWLWSIWDASLAAQGKKASAFVPVIVILMLNLIAASSVTQIRVPNLGPEQRGVIHQIIGGLSNPDFVEKKTTEQRANGKFLVPGPGTPDSLSPIARVKNEPYIEVSPSIVSKGDEIRIIGNGFAPDAKGLLNLLGADTVEVARFQTNARGSFTTTLTNPRDIPGDYFVQAKVVRESGGWTVSETLRASGPKMIETIYLALLGTVLSLVFAIPLSFLGARNLMSSAAPLKTVYALTRSLFTVLRSVEVLIIAVIAVAAVGIGPFAGVIALAIHGIGALGKLYSEAIESIDHGPIEAIRATGANELQVVVFAVVPQVVPQFIAFTLYRWDINVRMATVIGLVGGGGIGYQLIQYMNLLQWRQAATAIWLIAVAVMLMDYASAVIREKVI